MFDAFNSSILRELGYGFGAFTVLWAWRSELRIQGTGRLWPRFWLATALLLALLGAARALGIHDLVTEAGRSQAQSGEWYEVRRAFQSVAIATVSVFWLATCGLAVWKVPERRRRYLPAFLLTSSIVGFAAIRVVSLHQVDTVLYRTSIVGVDVVVFLELGLLFVLVLMVYRTVRVVATE